MKNKCHKNSMTHKTEYVNRPYIFTPVGVCEFLGYYSLSVVARIPGSHTCYLFPPTDVVFPPSVGKDVFYFFNGKYFAAEVLQVSFVDSELCFRIRVYDKRWYNPIRILSVSFDDIEV